MFQVLATVQLHYILNNAWWDERSQLRFDFLAIVASARRGCRSFGCAVVGTQRWHCCRRPRLAYFPDTSRRDMRVPRIALQEDGGEWPPQRPEHQRTPRVEDLQLPFFCPVLFPAPDPAEQNSSALALDGSPNVPRNDCMIAIMIEW
jgi:hypothetical protein